MTNNFMKIQELKFEKQDLEARLREYEEKYSEVLELPNLLKKNIENVEERIQRLEGENIDTSNDNDQTKKESWEVFL